MIKIGASAVALALVGATLAWSPAGADTSAPAAVARTAVTASAPSSSSARPAAAVPRAAVVRRAADRVVRQNRPQAVPLPTPATLKIMNYYPAGAGWTEMWTDYDHDRIDSDFGAIASLGANTVRLIVSPQAVGWPTLDPAVAAHVYDAVRTAAAHGLRVQLTLFDLWSGWTEIAKSQAWMSALLGPLAHDPTVALVELRNEMPISAASLAWAAAMLPTLATVLPGVPRTISTFSATDVQTLETKLPVSALDVIDIHLYGNSSYIAGVLAAAQKSAAGRPIIVGEAGKPTPGGTVGGEQAQLRFYQSLRQTLVAQGIPYFAPWILSDFTSAGLADFFRGTDRADTESTFGLRRLDGTWKPAAAAVRAMFANTASAAAQRSSLATGLAATSVDADGTFEQENTTPDSDGELGSWNVNDGSDAAMIGTSPSGGVGGSRVGVLTGTGGSASRVPSLYQGFALLNGSRTVSLSASVRLAAGSTGWTAIAIAWFKDSTYLSSSGSKPASTSTTGWQTLSVSAHAPAGANGFQVHLQSAHNQASTFFDNVTIGS